MIHKRMRWLLLLMPLLLMGCASLTNYDAPVVPPTGAIFTSVKHPLTTNFDDTQAHTTQRVEAQSTKFIWDWLFTGISLGWDDASIKAVAEQNGIKEVSYAEAEVFQVFLFYSQLKVVVYGN